MQKNTVFLKRLRAWYQAHQRSLPFRGAQDPYRIWVSEILLQQTQMSRGVIYYKRFMKRFPTIRSLAKASWTEFLPYFQGLGYYNRGRNMLEAARMIVEKHNGQFPQTEKELTALPGIGLYTAKALLAFAFQQPVLPVDTNVLRILGRIFLWQNKLDPKTPAGQKLIQDLMKLHGKFPTGSQSQAMMDFGSSICLMRKPKCLECPMFSICLYGPNEKPYLQERARSVREKYSKKYVQAEIYENKKLIKHKSKLLAGYLEQGDERTFLKQLVAKKMKLNISVRPAYKTWIEQDVKYSVHRCYVLARL